MDPELAPTIDTDKQVSPSINIDTGTAPAQPPSDDVAKTRAYKAHMGVGDIIKQGYDEIYRNIASGNEDNLRRQAAMEITHQAMEDKQKALVDLAAAKGTNLTLGDVQSLDTPPSDPTSVIEHGYARAYVNTAQDAAARLEDNVLTDAQSQDPEAVKQYMDRGSEVLSKREYALTKSENLQPDIERNRWFGFKDPFWGDQHDFSSYDVKQLLSMGFYESAMLRGNTKDTRR